MGYANTLKNDKHLTLRVKTSDNDPKYFIFPFFKMNMDSIIARKEKEKYFINEFKPELNST